jgi:hypothetical protein
MSTGKQASRVPLQARLRISNDDTPMNEIMGTKPHFPGNEWVILDEHDVMLH